MSDNSTKQNRTRRVSVPADQIEHNGDVPHVPDDVVDQIARMLLARAGDCDSVFSSN